MTTSTPPEDRLTERLRSLTDTIDGPVPTAAVLHRGRAAVRRKRVIGTTAALSLLAAAGVLSVSSGLLGHSEDGQRVVGPATSPSASSTPTHGRKDGKKDRKTDPNKGSDQASEDTSCNTTGPQRSRALDREYGSTVNAYGDLVVEHLDPRQLHMQKEDATFGPISFGPGCVLNGLSTRLGWTSPGDDGRGMVMVEVTTDWRGAQTRLAHGGWHPASSLPAGAVRAYVTDYPGGTAVAVTRTDGTTVALDAARLFGNNSVTPVTSMDVTTDELLATAADPGFQLP